MTIRPKLKKFFICRIFTSLSKNLSFDILPEALVANSRAEPDRAGYLILRQHVVHDGLKIAIAAGHTDASGRHSPYAINDI